MFGGDRHRELVVDGGEDVVEHVRPGHIHIPGAQRVPHRFEHLLQVAAELDLQPGGAAGPRQAEGDQVGVEPDRVAVGDRHHRLQQRRLRDRGRAGAPGQQVGQHINRRRVVHAAVDVHGLILVC